MNTTQASVHTERIENGPDGRQIVQTARHHRYFLDNRNADNDFECVRCGVSGHFSYILDYKPCDPWYVGLDHMSDDEDIIGNALGFDDERCRDLAG